MVLGKNLYIQCYKLCLDIACSMNRVLPFMLLKYTWINLI